MTERKFLFDKGAWGRKLRLRLAHFSVLSLLVCAACSGGSVESEASSSLSVATAEEPSESNDSGLDREAASDEEAGGEGAPEQLALDDRDSTNRDLDGGTSGSNAEAPSLPECDRAVTEANQSVVEAAIDELFVQGDISAVDRYWGEPYLQDNAVRYREIHRVIGDGNFVFTLSEGSVQGVEVAHYDLFRVDSGRIVEHWDGRRNVPATTASGLGLF